MQLQLDPTITYAIALEGGGAKGAYEIGAWRALEEAGIRYNAVSGTSVGALNGAMMCMRRLDEATKIWKDIRLSNVINVDASSEADLKKLVSGGLDLGNLHELLPKMLDIIRAGGLDVAPLRAWVREIIDEDAIRNSDVALYACTVSLSDRKDLEIKLNDLPEGEICDMLLASAYHPTFRQERLGGKYYTDGGLVDSLPLHVLVENGYRDIIAVRIPGHGLERRFKLPEDVHLTTIATRSDLGGVLNFSPEQSQQDMEIGYWDAKRVLYGLSGNKYYVDRTMTEEQAFQELLKLVQPGQSLRETCEKVLPAQAKRLGVSGDYYALLLAVLEEQAQARSLPVYRLYSDQELLWAVK
ncbi:MAG: patatin-like phospholipase family protein [Oscillospiraceae bacterium]|nr:patatin-like phospholipase family protein [Oscillospiraceae bacterium]